MCLAWRRMPGARDDDQFQPESRRSDRAPDRPVRLEQIRRGDGHDRHLALVVDHRHSQPNLAWRRRLADGTAKMKTQRSIRATGMLDRSRRTYPSDIDEFNHQADRLSRKISHEADADRRRAERVGKGDILFVRVIGGCAVRWRPLLSGQFIVRTQSGGCQLRRVDRDQCFSLVCVDQDLFR